MILEIFEFFVDFADTMGKFFPFILADTNIDQEKVVLIQILWRHQLTLNICILHRKPSTCAVYIPCKPQLAKLQIKGIWELGRVWILIKIRLKLNFDRFTMGRVGGLEFVTIHYTVKGICSALRYNRRRGSKNPIFTLLDKRTLHYQATLQ